MRDIRTIPTPPLILFSLLCVLLTVDVAWGVV